MDGQTGLREYRLSKKYTAYIFILLFLLYFFDYVDRMVVTSLFPYIKKEWGLSDAECGLLVSAVYWSIVLFTIPASILVDRWSRRKTIGLMAVVWSLATAACAFTGNFAQLFMARGVIGIGEAGYAPGGTAMLAGLYPREKRSRMMGIWNASIPLGSAVGIALGGIIAERWGWRHAFGLVALPGLIAAVLFFFVKDYKTVDLVRSDDRVNWTRMNAREILRQFTGTPSLIYTYFGFAAMTFVTTSMITWLPTFFNRVYNLPMDRAGIKGGSVMLLALVGAPVGGLLADLWLKKRKNARLLLSSIVAVLSALFLSTGLVFFTGTLQYVMILLMGLVVVGFVPAAAAVTQDVVHPGLRAISYALCVIVQNILGSSLGPIVVGSLSDSYDIHTALLVLPVFLIVAAALFYAGSRYYDRDLDRVTKLELEAER